MNKIFSKFKKIIYHQLKIECNLNVLWKKNLKILLPMSHKQRLKGNIFFFSFTLNISNSEVILSIQEQEKEVDILLHNIIIDSSS